MVTDSDLLSVSTLSHTCTDLYALHAASSISLSAVHSITLHGFPISSESPQISTYKQQHRHYAPALLKKVSIAEVVVVITGAGLEEEQGCGVCVKDLTGNLRELRTLIENSSSLLGSVNSTQEQLLENGIMESLVHTHTAVVIASHNLLLLAGFCEGI